MVRVESRYIAERIHRMMAEGLLVTEDGVQRPAVITILHFCCAVQTGMPKNTPRSCSALGFPHGRIRAGLFAAQRWP